MSDAPSAESPKPFSHPATDLEPGGLMACSPELYDMCKYFDHNGVSGAQYLQVVDRYPDLDGMVTKYAEDEYDCAHNAWKHPKGSRRYRYWERRSMKAGLRSGNAEALLMAKARLL